VVNQDCKLVWTEMLIHGVIILLLVSVSTWMFAHGHDGAGGIFLGAACPSAGQTAVNQVRNFKPQQNNANEIVNENSSGV
jgi:hypothetical protein